MAILKIANGIGKYYDNNSRESVIEYITNPRKTLNKNIGVSAMEGFEYAKEMDEVASIYHKNTGVRLRHFIISFESWEVNDPEVAYQIGQDIAEYLGREYQTVFSVHQDTDQLHIHIVINAVSYLDGHRYRGTRSEFYGFKEWVDMVLKRYGINRVRYISNHT